MQRGGRSPLVELLFIYQIKGLGMQQGKREEKKGRLDNKVDPNSEPGTSGVKQLLSFTCQQCKMDTSKKKTQRKKVQERQTATGFLFLSGRREGPWGDSVIHVTLHLRLAASSTCFVTTSPFASHGLGQLCPSMWTDTVRGVCIICLSALGLFVLS